MTAMMGLRTRMLLARLIVWISPDLPTQHLAGLAGEVSRAGANIVLLKRGSEHYPSLVAIKACHNGIGSRTMCGIEADSAVGIPAVDLILWGGRGQAPRPSRWSLIGVEGIEGLSNSDADLVILAAERSGQAAMIAPPAKLKSKPWFATVGSLDQAHQAIDAGARRLAIDLTGVGESAGGLADLAGVERCRELLTEPWRQDMAAVSLGSFRPPIL